MRPVETGAGQEAHRSMIEARMHTVAVEFDFVQPAVAFRRRVDQLRQLRRDPLWQRRRFAPLPARYGARHDGRHQRVTRPAHWNAALQRGNTA